MKRRCGRSGCTEQRRNGGRYCGGCFAAANRRSHAAHHSERNARRRDRAAERSAGARARDSARAKLYVAIARGKIAKGVCVTCGRGEVTAYIADPKRWREPVWMCRADRSEEMKPRGGAAKRALEEEAWAKRRDAALAAIAALPADVRARLYEIAAQGPAGVRLAPDAPLFVQRLVRAYTELGAESAAKAAPKPANEVAAFWAHAFAPIDYVHSMMLNAALSTIEIGIRTYARFMDFMVPP